MAVLDQLPEWEPARVLRELDAVQREMKARQNIGSKAVIMSRIASAATSDITIPAGDGRDVLLQFTPSDLSFGGGLCYRVFQSTDGGASFFEIGPSERLRVGSDGVQKWRVRYFNQYGGTDIHAKYAFFCVGSGTFTASLI